MQTFLQTNSDGSFTVVNHPGWMSGEEGPERLLTADELIDLGFGLLVIDNPPSFNPATQTLALNPISDWPKDARSATKTYTVTDLTTEQIRDAMPPITPRQLRLTLLSINITEGQIDAALADNPSGLIEWKYATMFKRTHPLISALIPTFSLTEEQVDSLWLYAADIT